MRIPTVIIAAAAVALLVGCLPSLHPLYTDSDIVFDQALIGDWYEEGEDEIWTFEKGEGGGYFLTIAGVEDDDEDADVDEDEDVEAEDEEVDEAGDDDVLEFRAFLFELDGRRFIDFYADPVELSESGYAGMIVPLHWFGTINIKGDQFDMAIMEGDTLRSMIKAGIDAPAYTDLDDYPLLTAPTEELQKFVRENIDRGLFTVKGRMLRK